MVLSSYLGIFFPFFASLPSILVGPTTTLLMTRFLMGFEGAVDLIKIALSDMVGEKLHESMISADDSPQIYEFLNYFKVMPAFQPG